MSNDISARRFLSLWLRRLSTDRIARHDLSGTRPRKIREDFRRETPLVTVAQNANALVLAGLNDAAARLGLTAGMPLADARAMHPHLRVVPADAAADRLLLENLAAWCLRYTPLVGLVPPDGLTLDITGCAHLFGGEATLRRDLLRRLEGLGFHARAAIADTIGAAHALARHGGPAIIAPGAQREALRELPLTGLRLDAETVQGLKQSGFTSIGALYPLPRAPLAARFGVLLWLQLDRALGRQGEAFTPLLPLPGFSVERACPEPLVRMEDVLTVAEELAERLTPLMAERGHGARGLELLLFRLDGQMQRLCAGTSRPLRDPAFIRRLFADRLSVCEDEYDPGFGYDLVRLNARETERIEAQQQGLGEDGAEAQARLIDRLTARLGEQRVLRLQEQDTHIPETACVALPVRDVKATALAPAPPQDTLLATRPLRLFAAPQPLDSEAIAEPPEGPPLRFRWRRAVHDVVASEGPERIAMEWWRGKDAPVRDYFRVVTRAGARLWLYREGQVGRQPRWFVHGLFA